MADLHHQIRRQRAVALPRAAAHALGGEAMVEPVVGLEESTALETILNAPMTSALRFCEWC